MIEARALDHIRVGTEHLLLGLLADDAGDAAEVLRAAGANLTAARHKVVEAVEAVEAETGSPSSGALASMPVATGIAPIGS